jgi:hypothetical protein
MSKLFASAFVLTKWSDQVHKKIFFFQAKVLKPIATLSSKADLLISVKYGYNFLVVLAKKESDTSKNAILVSPS